MATFQNFTPTLHVAQDPNLFRAGERIVTGQGSKTTGAMSNGVLNLLPIIIAEACTLTEIGSEVTTLVDGNVRHVIYADDTTTPGKPGALVLDCGAQAAVSGINADTISQAVSAGIYWLGVVQQGSTGTNTFRVTNILAGLQVRTLDTTTNLNQSRWCFQETSVTGEPPNPSAAVLSANTSAPVVYLERS